MVLLIYESKNGPLKGHYVTLKKKSKLRIFNIYNINELIIQTQLLFIYLFFITE